MKRVVTGVILAVFGLWAIFYSPQVIFIAITALIACACYHEFSGIARASGIDSSLLWIGYAAGLAAMWRPDTLSVGALIVMIAALSLKDLSKALTFSAAVLLGVIYVFLPWKWAVELRAMNPAWLFFAMSINWVGDTAAYVVGRAIGKNKLAPQVSPGKSWEGTIGAVVVCAIYGLIYNQQAHLGLVWPLMLALTILTNIAGQFGDLAESAFKRGAGVKDSGNLLPGHGGMLDRLDSSLFTLPLVYFFLIWFR